jgi:hypothetical protein
MDQVPPPMQGRSSWRIVPWMWWTNPKKCCLIHKISVKYFTTVIFSPLWPGLVVLYVKCSDRYGELLHMVVNFSTLYWIFHLTWLTFSLSQKAVILFNRYQRTFSWSCEIFHDIVNFFLLLHGLVVWYVKCTNRSGWLLHYVVNFFTRH